MHVVATAGHVDHGKSTLVERLTGIDPDRFAEEKRRGLTIDLGFAWFALPSGHEVGIVDVPGHERFIKNMLAGAGGVSVCMLVVAANEGWMPQSAEHLGILDVLEISHGVVAITKIDAVEIPVAADVEQDVNERLRDTSLDGATIVRCSAATEEGIAYLVTAFDRAVWSAPPPVDAGRPRVWIDRAFTISGAGTVVTGMLAGGRIAPGQEVEVSPSGRRARVRSIQTHKRRVELLEPGNRAALNLAGVARDEANRGDAVVVPDQWRATAVVDARIRVLPAAVTGRHHELREKGAHLLYIGSAETPVRVSLVNAGEIRAGERGYARLHLRSPLPLARGDRFVLRDAGRVFTLGGGIVLDPMPPKTTARDHGALLEKLDVDDAQAALAAIVEAEGIVRAEDAFLRAGTSEHPADVERLGASLVSPREARWLRTALRDALAAFHADRPLMGGMPREALRKAVAVEGNVFDALVAATDDVVEQGGSVRLASFSVELSEPERRERERVLTALSNDAFSPPATSDLAADPAVFRSLIDAHEVVRIGDFYFGAEAAQRARSLVRSAIEDRGPLTVAEIRDVLGTTRKFAVPLCEWLDATGATIRKGDRRDVGPRP